MPFKPFDAATKQLVELRPEDWITFLDLPIGAGAELMETDLATITTEADKVVRVQTDPPYLLHVEFQAGKDDIAERTLRSQRFALVSAQNARGKRRGFAATAG